MWHFFWQRHLLLQLKQSSVCCKSCTRLGSRLTLRYKIESSIWSSLKTDLCFRVSPMASACRAVALCIAVKCCSAGVHFSSLLHCSFVCLQLRVAFAQFLSHFSSWLKSAAQWVLFGEITKQLCLPSVSLRLLNRFSNNEVLDSLHRIKGRAMFYLLTSCDYEPKSCQSRQTQASKKQKAKFFFFFNTLLSTFPSSCLI